MKYYCQYPGCDYCTDIRSQINYHHIKPVELGGSDDFFNRLYLCPNHHTKIYIPYSKSGQHKFKGEDSIIILAKYSSTIGIVVEYSNIYDEIKYFLENSDKNSSLIKM